jgi:hypothetical protein
MLAHREPIISAAARHDVPAIYTQPDFARDGGLFSYDVDRVDNWRRAASYVGRFPSARPRPARSRAICRCSFRPSSRWS